jgi:plasmid stabilization system protein ParE
MAHRVVWSPRAAKDLDSITDYIAADSPTYAGTVLKNVVNQTRILARFPQAGRMVPEFDDENMRELIVVSVRLSPSGQWDSRESFFRSGHFG